MYNIHYYRVVNYLSLAIAALFVLIHHRVNDAKAKNDARNAVTENKNIFWSDDAAKIVPGLSPLLFRLLSLISGLLSLVSCLSYPVSCIPSPFIYHPSPL